MQTIVIIVHLLIVIALVGTILIQQSDGRDLGVGGNIGFATTRSAKNALTRLTAILASCFFLTSVILSVLQAISNNRNLDVIDQLPISSQNQDVAPLSNPIDHHGIQFQQDGTNTADWDDNNLTIEKESTQ